MPVSMPVASLPVFSLVLNSYRLKTKTQSMDIIEWLFSTAWSVSPLDFHSHSAWFLFLTGSGAM